MISHQEEEGNPDIPRGPIHFPRTRCPDHPWGGDRFSNSVQIPAVCQYCNSRKKAWQMSSKRIS